MMVDRGARRPVVVLVAAGAVGVALLSGCGSSGGGGQQAGSSSSAVAAAPSSSSSSSSSSSGSGMPATATTIMIQDFQYRTPPSVSPGSTVSVMNMDDVAHTVTADSGAFDLKTPPGQTVTFTAPTTPGTYPYHCTYHGNMHGVLVVK